MKKQNLSSKKNVFCIVLAMFVCLFGLNNLWAQTAVLAHEGELSIFYGPSSFAAAYNVAIDGDVITLSEGNFSPCTVSKSITVHGAGAFDDPVAGSFATHFIDNITVGSNPIIEGISFGTVSLADQSSPQFVKCNFGAIQPYVENGVHCQTVLLTNCFVLNLIGVVYWEYGYNHTSQTAYIDNYHLVNSVIWSLSNHTGQGHVVSNSIIRQTSNTYSGSSYSNCVTYNSVFILAGGYKPANTCTFYNCIGIKNGNEGQVFENSLNSTVVEYDNITDVFPAFVGEDIFNEEFILDEGIAASFLGNNGTEVGIHGGYYPYSNRPGYMKVRHCTVGDRTTDDGHLSVDIEVVTEE